tara:strand:- start:263 stop:1213 length:951 start_codon:yes stop_codon:yes gene_type:complete
LLKNKIIMKHFINLKDIPAKDLRKIITDAKKRKSLRKNLSTLEPDKRTPLKGKLLIQMFEKSSLRTRLSFYLAIKQLGGTALTLRPDELHIGTRSEPISDTAKILGTYADLFMLRTDSEKKLELFKKNLNIPLINGLSPDSHPAQILSDIFTIEEIKKKTVSKLNICWIGDSNNVLNSLVEASIKFDFNLKIACPKEYMPKKKLMEWIKKNNGKVYIFNNPLSAIKNSDVLLTDKVISMNDRVNKSYKIKKFKKFKINDDILKYAKKDLIILHCLPRGDEITENVFNSVRSKVWTQASNRVHVQKSILLYCLNKLR